MYPGSTPMVYPPNRPWGTAPTYASTHTSSPPPKTPTEDYNLPAVPQGTSFDSIGSHGTTAVHDYMSVAMMGSQMSQQITPLSVPFHPAGYTSHQVVANNYVAYPHSYGMYNNPTFYSSVRSAPSTNMWPLPTPPPPAAPPLLLVYDITPDDVLCGRGGATNSHSGNRAFRSLVKKYQNGYLKAKKRDKPAVASVIVDLVRKRGGRFLRRYERTAANGQVLWIDIGDDRAREKTCQALRENAPEIRRRKKKRSKKHRGKIKSSSSTTSSSSTSSDELDYSENNNQHCGSDEKHEPDQTISGFSLTPAKSKCDGRSLSTGCSVSSNSTALTTNGYVANNKDTKRRRHSRKASNPVNYGAKISLEDSKPTNQCSLSPSHSSMSSASSTMFPCFIQPMKKFLPKRLWQTAPIPVDGLDEYDREHYLRDFIPPSPVSESDSKRSDNTEESYIEAKQHSNDEVRNKPDCRDFDDLCCVDINGGSGGGPVLLRRPGLPQTTKLAAASIEIVKV